MSDDVAATEQGMQNMTGHNAKARKTIIRDVMRQLDDLEGQIATLQAERTKIRNTRIKGDLGMKVANFNVLRRFRALEEEDRADLFDVLREGFKALAIGVQSSFLDPLDAVTEPAVLTEGEVVPHNQARPTNKFDAENCGYLAGKAGKGPDDMPLMRSKIGLQKAWLTGNERGLTEYHDHDGPKRALDDFDRAEQEAAAEV